MNSERLEEKKKCSYVFSGWITAFFFLKQRSGQDFSTPSMDPFSTDHGAGAIESGAERLRADVRSLSPSPNEQTSTHGTARL